MGSNHKIWVLGILKNIKNKGAHANVRGCTGKNEANLISLRVFGADTRYKNIQIGRQTNRHTS